MLFPRRFTCLQQAEFLEPGRCTEYAGIVGPPADDLKAAWQAVTRESAWHRGRGIADQVERKCEHGSLVRGQPYAVDRRRIVQSDLARRTGLGWRNKQIVLIEQALGDSVPFRPVSHALM